MQIEKEKYDAVVLKYGQLSRNALEKTTAEAYAASVKGAVSKAQEFADQVVNALEKELTDESSAALEEALKGLLTSPTPVAKHWLPFVSQAAEAAGLVSSTAAATIMIPDAAELQKHLEDVLTDRDEWKAQHANALASWKTDVDNLNAKNAALEAQLVAVVSAQPPPPIVLPAGTDLKLDEVPAAPAVTPPQPGKSGKKK